MVGELKIISEDLIKLDLKAENKLDAINELAELLFQEKKITSIEGFVESIKKREDIMSTYCGFDVAIPHAVSEFVDKPAFAFGRTNGFSWGEDDGDVKYVFLLAIPAYDKPDSQSKPHIDMMSSIAQLALDENVRAKWESAKSKEQVLESFKVE